MPNTLTDNLVALWEFREASGAAVADLSALGKTLTLTNGPTRVTGPTVPMEVLPAVDFDGTNDYGTSNAGAKLRDGSTNDLSFVAWLRIDATGRNDFVCWKNLTGDENDVSFYVNAATKLEARFVIAATGDVVATGGTVLSIDTWYHVAVTKSADVWTIYLNGVSDGTGSADDTLSFHDSDVLWVGSNHDIAFAPIASQNLNGKLAQVGIWNRALTATEVRILSNTGAVFAGTPYTTSDNVLSSILTPPNVNPLRVIKDLYPYPQYTRARTL